MAAAPTARNDPRPVACPRRRVVLRERELPGARTHRRAPDRHLAQDGDRATNSPAAEPRQHRAADGDRSRAAHASLGDGLLGIGRHAGVGGRPGAMGRRALRRGGPRRGDARGDAHLQRGRLRARGAADRDRRPGRGRPHRPAGYLHRAPRAPARRRRDDRAAGGPPGGSAGGHAHRRPTSGGPSLMELATAP